MKLCVCGGEVDHFDVYYPEVDPSLSGPQGIDGGYYGIIGVKADGKRCCSALHGYKYHQTYEDAAKLAAKFNARPNCDLGVEAGVL